MCVCMREGGGGMRRSVFGNPGSRFAYFEGKSRAQKLEKPSPGSKKCSQPKLHFKPKSKYISSVSAENRSSAGEAQRVGREVGECGDGIADET